VILVGDDPASLSYITAKEKALAEAGMKSRDLRLPADTTEAELLALICRLNGDEKVHGIPVQLPLPAHVSEERVIVTIDPAKDADGFHPVSVGNMVLSRSGFLPCTPHEGTHSDSHQPGRPLATMTVTVAGPPESGSSDWFRRCSWRRRTARWIPAILKR